MSKNKTLHPDLGMAYAVEQVFRTSDNELMGTIQQVNDDMWQPSTIFGYALGEPTTKQGAADYLRVYGLEALIDRWEFLDTDDEWYACQFVEVQPEMVTIRISDYGHPDVHQSRTLTEPRTRVRKV